MKILGFRKMHNDNSTYQYYERINNSVEKGFQYGTNYKIIPHTIDFENYKVTIYTRSKN